VSSKKTTPEETSGGVKVQQKHNFPWPTVLAWGVTAAVIVILLLVLFQKLPISGGSKIDATAIVVTPLAIDLPGIETAAQPGVDYLYRKSNLDTIIPSGARNSVIKYTVVAGDSIFGIAKVYGVKPESIVWANDDYFGGNPTVPLSIGIELNIPPTDGVLYQWKDGDTLKKVAYDYNSTVQKIVAWPSNGLDAQDPVLVAGSKIMIPGGSTTINEFNEEFVYSPRSGVTQVIQGVGGCEITSAYVVAGGVNFMWPTGQHDISGFDFDPSTHKGIDIAVYEGEPVYASESGTVVYAGWNTSGYGNMVMIDHNNGYQTLYAHMENGSITVACGDPVARGQQIGNAGSTGNSTGPHLHFEIRYLGTWRNPHNLLP
jgi:murein DD-endopeptidase MepM/ murein hydrolase activator NlpD